MNGYRFLSFARKYKKQVLHTGLDSLKNSSKKVVYKTGEFLGNKIAYKIVKPKHVIDENPRNVEEIFIVPEKENKYKENKTSIIKMEKYKMYKLLNDSTVSKFVTKKWIQVSYISRG